MALVSCPECEKKVSDSAPSCPNCGVAIADAQVTHASGARLTTTQGTSKKLKMHTLISAVMFAVGIIGLFTQVDASEPPVWPSFVMTAGIVWYLVTRFRIWWHHK